MPRGNPNTERLQSEILLLLHSAKAEQDPAQYDLEKALVHSRAGKISSLHEAYADIGLAASRCRGKTLKQRIERVMTDFGI